MIHELVGDSVNLPFVRKREIPQTFFHSPEKKGVLIVLYSCGHESTCSVKLLFCVFRLKTGEPITSATCRNFCLIWKKNCSL